MIDIEIVDNDPKGMSLVKKNESIELQEELATAILNKFKDVDKLNLRFTDSSLTTKEKLQAIINFKTALLLPSLRSAMGLEFSISELKGAYNVLEILDNIESSILSLAKYEQSEDIDFTHPKIVSSYTMLFEIIVEIMNEEIKETVLVNNIIEKVAVRCVGLEQELNKKFKNVSNKMSEYISNPIIEPFKQKNNPENVKKHLEYIIERTVNSIGREDTLNILKHVVYKMENKQ